MMKWTISCPRAIFDIEKSKVKVTVTTNVKNINLFLEKKLWQGIFQKNLYMFFVKRYICKKNKNASEWRNDVTKIYFNLTLKRPTLKRFWQIFS